MTDEATVVTGLEPRAFWAHFEALTRIPRPSRAEEPVIEHVRAWAAEHDFELHQDSGRNLVLRVPATPGRETAPVVALQGHLDMVCEREPSSPNDPAEGRIVLVRDGDWLKADGTTLGADDGVAIAAMMALAEDASLPHGPLELLMTVAEEVGLEGANAFDGSLVDRPHPRQPRQRGGREADRRVRGEHRHVDPRRRTARGPCRGRCRAGRDGERRARRPLRDEHRVRPVERGQGARPRVARGTCDRPLPSRLPPGREEPQRDPARCDGRGVRRGRSRAGAARGDRSVGGDDPRRVLEDRCRRRRDRGRGGGDGRPVDGSGDDRAARRDRARADGTSRDEPGLRRPRRDVDLARRGRRPRAID